MTLNTSNGEDGHSEGFLSTAQESYQNAADALLGLINQVKAGKLPPASDAQRVLRDANILLVLALKERERLEELCRKEAGVVHGYALDFGAARDEIGRRMARLRAAAGSGDISE
ncbi:MAG: hypothetical protein ACC631_02655 [Halocynthiibacter sp.]